MPDHKVLVDEHIGKSIVGRLNSYGVESFHLDEVGLKGSSDKEITDYAEENDFVVLTRDDDFKELVNDSSAGLLFLTNRLRKKKTASEVMKVLNSIPAQEMKGEIIHIPW